MSQTMEGEATRASQAVSLFYEKHLESISMDITDAAPLSHIHHPLRTFVPASRVLKAKATPTMESMVGASRAQTSPITKNLPCSMVDPLFPTIHDSPDSRATEKISPLRLPKGVDAFPTLPIEPLEALPSSSPNSPPNKADQGNAVREEPSLDKECTTSSELDNESWLNAEVYSLHDLCPQNLITRS